MRKVRSKIDSKTGSTSLSADFDEQRKILILASKLKGPAADTLKQLKREHPSRARSFDKIIETLTKRFHGNETHNHYAEAYKRCVRLDNESVRDYAGRVTKLFQHTYPEMVGEETTALTGVIATMMMDKFRAGLQRQLRKRITNKKFKTFEDMIECVEGYVTEEDREAEEVQAVEHIRAAGYYQRQQSAPQHAQKHDTDAAERRHIEMMSLMNRLLIERNNPIPDVQQSKQEHTSERKKFSYVQNTFCGHCKLKGHTLEDCKAKTNLCNLCNRIGHFYNRCPENPKSPTFQGTSEQPQSNSSSQANIPKPMPRQTPEN